MATSKIILYNTNITPDRNCLVDNFTTYLSNCYQSVIDNFQYQKIQMNMKIKIENAQTYLPENAFNYVGIKNSDNSKTYYYFIVGEPRWLSANTTELTLYMDTINTFNGNLTWTSKTHITRQHKDRYYKDSKTADSSFTYVERYIDDYDEGINPVKYLSYEQKITNDKINMNWYLIYRNKKDVTTDTVVPIECQCCGSVPLETNATVRNGLNESDVPNKSSVLILANDNATDFVYTTAAGKTYTIGRKQTYKGLLLVKYDGQRDFSAFGLTAVGETQNITFENGRSTTVLQNYTLKCHQFTGEIIKGTISYPDAVEKVLVEPNETYTIGSATLNCIDDVDKTDTKLVKIIKMPYAPFEISITKNKLDIPSGWRLVNGFLVPNDLGIEFITTVGIAAMATGRAVFQNTDLKNYKNTTAQSVYEYKPTQAEPKLLHSAFHTERYLYDNFDKELLLERYIPNNDPVDKVVIKFKQSNNISSNSLFDFSFPDGTYKKVNLYDNYLNVNRTNELALYNSDYLNYIRNGYNYDKKALAQQTASNWLGVGINIASAIASFALTANPISAAAGITFASQTIVSLANSITQRVQGEASLQEKLDNYKERAASVSNTTDLDLLSYYNGNRLWLTREDISDSLRDGIYNLFRLTGYGCDKYEVPVTNTRVWYNYIQCSPDFNEAQWLYGKEILDDIKGRYQTGVTRYHAVDGEYDWNQEKENFETWLVTNS